MSGVVTPKPTCACFVLVDAVQEVPRRRRIVVGKCEQEVKIVRRLSGSRQTRFVSTKKAGASPPVLTVLC